MVNLENIANRSTFRLFFFVFFLDLWINLIIKFNLEIWIQ